MTLIYEDGKAPYEVSYPPRKVRKPSGIGRFAEIKVGDQLVTRLASLYAGIPDYWIVTDLWFDPVAGQANRTSGMMAAIQRLRDGVPWASKRAHTLRGLASNGFRYATIDAAATQAAAKEALKSGAVVGIGHGLTIRKRPKMAGGRL